MLSDYEGIAIPSSGLVVDYDGYVTVRTGASGTGQYCFRFYKLRDYTGR